MGKTTMIELRQDTSDLVSESEPAIYKVTLAEPLILNANDELGLSSVFVDSVAQNSGKIVIDSNNTAFQLKSFLYHNNYNTLDASKKTFKRTGIDIVKGINDGYDYVVCKDTGTKTNTTDLTTQIKIEIDLDFYSKGFGGQHSRDCSFHFVYTTITGGQGNFVWSIPSVDFKPFMDRAPKDSKNDIIPPVYYTTDDHKAIFKTYPAGFPFDYLTGTLKPDSPFQTRDLKGLSGFTNSFVETHSVNSFDGIKLDPLIITYNFTIPANAYAPQELAKLITDKMANGNLQTTDDGLTYTDEINDDQNKYFNNRSFNSPFLKLASDCIALNSPQTTLYSCRTDGEGIVRIDNDNFIVGSSEMGVEWDDEQSKFYFSQLHTPFYITIGSVSTMGTSLENVLGVAEAVTTDYFIANKTGGVGFTKMQPEAVWFGLMGFNTNIITNFGLPTYQKANYIDIKTASFNLANVCPIVFTLNDGINTTGNFNGLDSGVLKITPQEKPDLTKLSDTSQIIRTIYAKNPINQGGTLPYYLIEIDGKGVNSDIRGSKGSVIRNTKISAIVGRFYQTESYTSSIDGSGSIPYIHPAGSQPLILDTFRIRILDPNGTVTQNIQNSNVVFLQHISSQ